MKNNNVGKIIVALDVSSKEEALSLVRQLKDTQVFKVGLQLFTAEGPLLVQCLHDLGKKVFLDLKLHDIPHQFNGIFTYWQYFFTFNLFLMAPSKTKNIS